MKLQDVILKAMAKKITWMAAAEIAGMSVRNMQRKREAYQEHGYNGLFDRRRGKNSYHGVPMETAEKVLALYRNKYPDFQRAAFPGKAEGSGKHQLELQLGETSAARRGLSGQAPQARSASPPKAATSDARDAAAHRRQQAPLVSR
jgi:hypothetical protein